MNIQTKNDIRSRARMIYGLNHILKEDIDELRTNARYCELDPIVESIGNINDTIEKMIDIVAEIEYALYLEKNKGSQ